MNPRKVYFGLTSIAREPPRDARAGYELPREGEIEGQQLEGSVTHCSGAVEREHDAIDVAPRQYAGDGRPHGGRIHGAVLGQRERSHPAIWEFRSHRAAPSRDLEGRLTHGSVSASG